MEDVTAGRELHQRQSGVRSELAVPLIVKNKVIGVIDLQSEYSRLSLRMSISGCWS